MSRKKFNLKIEYAFIVIGLIFGTLLVFYNPPFQTNDEDRHFYNSYQHSRLHFYPDSENGYMGVVMPLNLTRIVGNFQGIPFSQGRKISKSRIDEIAKEPLNASDSKFYPNIGSISNPIAYIPSAIGIFFGGLINDNPVWLGWFGRLGGLLGYLIIVFFAIRIIPIFKGFVFLWALSPMALFQASSVTYDTLNNSLSILIIALIFHYALVKEKLERNDYILLICLALINVFTKVHTILIPLLYFIIPKDKRAGWSISLLFLILFPVLYLFPQLTWGKYIASYHLKGVGLWKDFEWNLAASLKENLMNPLHFISKIIKNIIYQRREWTSGAFGRFGYSYTKLPEFVLIIHGLVLIGAAFLESNKKFLLNIKQKTIIFSIGVLTALIVILGMLLESSPVGANMVFGLQGRYFIPMLPLIFIIFYNNNFEFKVWNKYKVYVLSVYAIMSLTYTVAFINDYFYVP